MIDLKAAYRSLPPAMRAVVALVPATAVSGWWPGPHLIIATTVAGIAGGIAGWWFGRPRESR